MTGRQETVRKIEHTAEFFVLLLFAGVVLIRLLQWSSAPHLTLISF